MRPTRLLFMVAVMALGATGAHAAGAVGDWMTPMGRGKVHIAQCGASLCGALVWLKEPIDPTTGRPKLDVKNPDGALRTRSLLGLQFLSGFKSTGVGRWGGGRIYDPQTGKTYDSKMSLTPGDGLKVEGCVAMFCQAQMWTPAR